MSPLRSFLSPSGSFSQSEFAIATAIVLVMAILILQLPSWFPATITAEQAKLSLYLIYPVWGAAIGKRSRDLGTTFTYGMVVGMLFPLLGVVFLFQGGKKAAAAKARHDSPGAFPP